MAVDSAADWVPVAVAFLAGGGFKTALEMGAGWLTKSTEKRRTEVDRMAKLLAEAEAAKKVAERRERIATEWGHTNRVAAIRAGAEVATLYELDFRDD